MATAIGDLVVRLGMDTKGFKAGATGARASLRTFAAGVAIAGATAMAAIVKLTRAVQAEMKVMDQIGKHAQRLNMATEALVGLQHQAELTGAGTAVLDKGLKKMMQSIGEVAAFGTGESKYAFDALGLNPQKMMGMAPDKQYAMIADALGKVQSQTERVAIATKIFGRAGTDLLIMLDGGSSAMQEAAKDAEHLGLTFSAVDHQKIAMANDEWYRMKSAFQGLLRQLAVQFAPIMGTAAKLITEFFVEWRHGIERVGPDTNVWIEGLKGVGVALKNILIWYHEKEAIETRIQIAALRAFGAEESRITELSKIYGDHLRRVRELEKVDWGKTAVDTFNEIANATRDSSRYMADMADMSEALAERMKPATDAAELFNKWLREAIQFNMTDRQKQIDDLLAAGAPPALIDNLRAADKALTALEQRAERQGLADKLNEQFQSPLDKYLARVKEIESVSGMLGEGVRDRAIKDARDEFLGADKGFEQPRYSGAMMRGSSEAYSTIVRAMTGDGVNKKILTESQKQTRHLESLDRKSGGKDAGELVSIPI